MQIPGLHPRHCLCRSGIGPTNLHLLTESWAGDPMPYFRNNEWNGLRPLLRQSLMEANMSHVLVQTSVGGEGFGIAQNWRKEQHPQVSLWAGMGERGLLSVCWEDSVLHLEAKAGPGETPKGPWLPSSPTVLGLFMPLETLLYAHYFWPFVET